MSVSDILEILKGNETILFFILAFIALPITIFIDRQLLTNHQSQTQKLNLTPAEYKRTNKMFGKRGFPVLSEINTYTYDFFQGIYDDFPITTFSLKSWCRNHYLRHRKGIYIDLENMTLPHFVLEAINTDTNPVKTNPSSPNPSSFSPKYRLKSGNPVNIAHLFNQPVLNYLDSATHQYIACNGNGVLLLHDMKNNTLNDTLETLAQQATEIALLLMRPKPSVLEEPPLKPILNCA